MYEVKGSVLPRAVYEGNRDLYCALWYEKKSPLSRDMWKMKNYNTMKHYI